jgi:hypothetical protein
MKKKRRKKHPSAESSSATYTCPSCLEPVDTFPDPGGGSVQTYVEDCSLCCRPNVLHVRWDEDEGTWSIEASRES